MNLHRLGMVGLTIYRVNDGDEVEKSSRGRPVKRPRTS